MGKYQLGSGNQVIQAADLGLAELSTIGVVAPWKRPYTSTILVQQNKTDDVNVRKTFKIACFGYILAVL